MELMSYNKLFTLVGVASVAVFFVGGVFSVAKAVSVPTLDNVVATSSCAIQLDWTQTDPADFFQFGINFDNGGFGGWNRISGISCPSGSEPCNLTYIREELDPDHTHEYKLRAFKSGEGHSGESNSLSDTLPVINSSPSLPVAFQVIEWSGANPSPLLTWTPSSEPLFSGFRVWRSEYSGGAWTAFDTLGPGGTFTLDEFNSASEEWNDTIDPDIAYKYRIQTYQTDEYCKTVDDITTDADPWVNFSTAFSDELVIPRRPTSLTATDVSGGGTQFTFSWDDADNETGYELQISINGGAYSSHTYGQDVTLSGPFVFDGGQAIDYQVRALWVSGDDNSHSAFFQGAQFVTGEVSPTDLGARIMYTSSGVYGADVYLEWNDNAGYSRTARIYRRVAGDSWPGTPVAELTGNCAADPSPPHTYNDLGIPLGEEYEYEVRFGILDACGGTLTGESAPSNISSINLTLQYILKGVGWASAGDGSVGWVKFNSASENGSVPSSVDYSVQVDRDGLFSGAAWASIEGGHGYGWFSFDKADLTGCPSGSCEARLDSGTGEVNGWARFLNPQSFLLGESDWDGWVHLRGTAQNGNAYGVSFDEVVKTFSGAAWGDDVVGWIGFGDDICDTDNSINGSACTVRAEQINRAPTISNVTIRNGPIAEQWCDVNPFFSVGWEYTDPDGDPRTIAEIEFIGPTTHLETDTNTEGAFNQSYPLYDPLAFLQASSTYSARVRVFDGIDWSGWVSSGADTETTPTHYPPLVDFEWSPTPVTTGAIINFNGEDGTTKTENRSGGLWPPSGWTWVWDFFGNASPNQPDGSKVSVIFNTLPSDVTLKVTDGSGDFCETTIEDLTGGAGTPLKRRIFRER